MRVPRDNACSPRCDCPLAEAEAGQKKRLNRSISSADTARNTANITNASWSHSIAACLQSCADRCESPSDFVQVRRTIRNARRAQCAIARQNETIGHLYRFGVSLTIGVEDKATSDNVAIVWTGVVLILKANVSNEFARIILGARSCSSALGRMPGRNPCNFIASNGVALEWRRQHRVRPFVRRSRRQRELVTEIGSRAIRFSKRPCCKRAAAHRED